MSNNSYIVLARKYRPQNFSEVIGQEVLVRTLTNSIKNNKVHHAYILTGIRGVGKTTTARIIAKTLNCLDESRSKNADACGICTNCVAIANSRHQDVIEIDAASRTGVDDIREIIDSIAYAPVMSRYKIFIIDEVHMLSNSAFNALLKTLEEPPSHVKFVFATTEIKKVPITILSRCQRFDLRRLDDDELSVHLKNILTKEGFKFDQQAISLIASHSDGSVRDSLSLADQALSANNHENFLSSDVVIRMMGLNDQSKIIDLFISLVNSDFKSCIKKFEEIYLYSSDISQILNELLSLTHIVSKSIIIEDNEFLKNFDSNSKDKLNKQIKESDISKLTQIWQMLNKGIQEINFSISSKKSFEMLLLRICYLESLIDLKQIISNLDEDKKNLDNNHDSEIYFEKKLDQNEISDKNLDGNFTSEILRNFDGSKLIS